MALDGSRIRSTSFSPNSVGKALTRKSMALVLDNLSLIRPSCGTRFSEMSILDMTFKREAKRVASCSGGLVILLSTPSTR